MKEKLTGLCATAFWLGLSGLVLIPITVLLSLLNVDTGAMSPLTGLVFPLALAALILGIVGIKGHMKGSRNRRFALLGIIFGSISIGLILILIVFVMLLFLPMFGM